MQIRLIINIELLSCTAIWTIMEEPEKLLVIQLSLILTAVNLIF